MSQAVEACGSKLTKAAFIKWIRTRYLNKGRRNNNYLYFPDDLVRETSIEQIFTDFDADGSGGLSREEVYQMFNGFGIPISMEDLEQLYDSVEVNLAELDCVRFKKCALSDKSERVFRNIVRQIDMKGYLPHDFTNTIIYLVYLSKREQIRLRINKENIPIEEKFGQIKKLLQLKNLSLNNQRMQAESSEQKKNLRAKLTDVWAQANQRHGSAFPMTAKLEEELHSYFLARKSD